MAGKLALWIPLDADVDALLETFRDDPARWLPQPAHPRGPGHWALVAHAGTVVRTVTCMIGEPATDRTTVTRIMSWRADPERGRGPARRLFPSLRGALVLRAAPEGADLHLQATYRRPAGSIGAALGPAQVYRLANAAATRFLQDVAARLLAEAGS